MTKKQLEYDLQEARTRIEKLEDIIRKPFEFTEEHTRIALLLGDKRLYITKSFDVKDRLDIHCEAQVAILPNASNSFYITLTQG